MKGTTSAGMSALMAALIRTLANHEVLTGHMAADVLPELQANTGYLDRQDPVSGGEVLHAGRAYAEIVGASNRSKRHSSLQR